eukprot:CAMPEP_0172600926 /NCGR_PEP_ID=MMETSP1068-20121228/21078_1 /TAXON_ID=35684 /ORGANISM="Pseudopedinella elastica, Strain CCMP716" /LENGTH=303 /DNA_ID=CAMNT_0013401747 /DNA_START=154 /DNA_END=1065 /DNA_ORIENTATION=+
MDEEESATITSLCEEVLSVIFDHVSPTTALEASLVCRDWGALTRGQALWGKWLEAFLRERKYVGPTVFEEPSPLRRYFAAKRDATRAALSAREISSFEWCMRFKSAAGAHFKDLDPWWNGRPPLRLKLLLGQFEPGPEAASRTNSADRAQTPGTTPGTTEGEAAERLGGVDESMLVVPVAPNFSQFWGHVGSPAGHWEYRINPVHGCAEVRVNGFPSYLVGRHPRHGGVYMHSSWVVWTAFEMPPKGQDPLSEDAGLAQRTSPSAKAYHDYQVKYQVNRREQSPLLPSHSPRRFSSSCMAVRG